MSRIGKKPVTLPKGVTLDLQGQVVAVKGPKGELRRSLHPEMQLSLADGNFTVARPSEEKRHKALHGLTRTLVQNMVDGVSKGFSKTLEIQGVGYKAEAKPYGVNLIVSNKDLGSFQQIYRDAFGYHERLYNSLHSVLKAMATT